jgi:hypothetical protein
MLTVADVLYYYLVLAELERAALVRLEADVLPALPAPASPD